jgi:hypothetical protein
MAERDHYKPSTFYLGNTEVDLELIQMINTNLERFEDLKSKQVPGYQIQSFSLRTVKKFVMVSGRIGTGKIGPNHVIEVVDYDPVRDSAIALGSAGQPPDVSLHWFIYRALPDVNGIARMDVSLSEAQMTEAGITVYDKKMEVLRPDAVMDLLPFFEDKKGVLLPGQGLVFYDRSFNDLVGTIMEFLEGSGKFMVQAPAGKEEGEE